MGGVRTIRAISVAAGVTALGLAAVMATPQRAQACGGCFAPTETVTVVTAHRMAVAISPEETTLWDQIEYAGDPEDFVWVLPIDGEVLVELADNGFFEALDQSTRVTLQGTFPPLQTFCPDPCGGLRGSAFDSAGTPPPTAPDPVTVFGEAVVGPYETATVGSEDPRALLDWLQSKGYAVPDSILPVITHYVDLGMNFSVLRLNPNAGVNQMQPVRVTTPGMNPVFPLRMVAAGVEGNVSLELYVFGEGRYEAQNFDVVTIAPEQLVFDWSTNAFNYAQAFESALANAGGRAWVAEYAQNSDAYARAVEGYSVWDEETGEPTFPARADFEVATRSIPSPYLTKLRTDISVDQLDQDLILQASETVEDVENFILVDNEINRPPEPDCPTVCTDPTGPSGGVVGAPSGPLGFRESGRGDGLCTAGGATPAGALAALSLVAGALLLRRRRR